MRTNAARRIGIFAAMALAFGLGATVEPPSLTGNAAYQVLADETSPHIAQP